MVVGNTSSSALSTTAAMDMLVVVRASGQPLSGGYQRTIVLGEQKWQFTDPDVSWRYKDALLLNVVTRK